MNQFVQFILHHWALSLAFFSVLILIFINEFIASKKKAIVLLPSEVVEKINHENALIIDIRDNVSFRNGHILNAIHSAENDFTTQKMDKYKNDLIILVCARGNQSGALASKLTEQGFAKAMVLAGGIEAWKTENFPLVKGK